ncbi:MULTISPECIES: hypothetical protein [Halobacillus]|uniref:hypothetical protein n=1 Tax=Halobacillus TaxID=45667 RepID=UPI0013D4CFD1|nr:MULTISPECIES: hypothetical protein [Halobacillus]
MSDDKLNNKHSKEQFGNIKSYQEINNEVSKNEKLKHKQPTPQPQDFEEIEY